ncbi:pyridoxamine 5'-phosphate oxidase family protein [Vibrio sp. S9_S30]|uniref:pyridoxamine 5'-phosphate oxidase family protein n=1 Tax=Vibrio sp. S9_S30 TaxID=2720226 RepID=UPI00167FEA06|nr:pyridoxamine 5'-phosphate oxidase family protein [Vibrio sp. S9_S30]MBD1557366.1 pyridoxamine 5'-phosphate oxidase family protein [Vibrio sp. S9_S30]
MQFDLNDIAKNSVLCWLSTSDLSGQPNVSPKELFHLVDSKTLLIADIASPQSVANLAENANVCVCMLDIFRQRGVKLIGKGRYARWQGESVLESERLLVQKVGNFPLKGIITIDIASISSVIAPSYWVKPEQSVEEKVADAMVTYGVQPADDESSKKGIK